MEVRGNLPEQFRHSDRILIVGGKFLFLKTVLKGQLISKFLFGIFNSPKKRTKKLDFNTMVPQVELFRSFFGRIEDAKKTFRN